MTKLNPTVFVTAGSAGVGKKILEYFSPNSRSFSRQNNFDIRTPEVRKRIAEMSLNCDIFVNHAYALDQSQNLLLTKVFKSWERHGKIGYIFNTSSYLTHDDCGKSSDYINHKKELDQLSYQYSKRISYMGLPFRMTNLRPGLLDTPKSRKKTDWPGVAIDGTEVAKLIEHFFHLPPHLQLIDIVLDSIQKGKDGS